MCYVTAKLTTAAGPRCFRRGTVIIIAEEGNRIDIPDHSVLENKIVTGSLRILDH